MEFLKSLGIELNNEIETVKTPEIIKTVKPEIITDIDNIVLEVLDKTGLNWDVKQSPSTFDAGEFGIKESDNKMINWRSDNGHEIGHVGKDSYNIFQNADAVKTVLEAGKGLFDAGHEFKHPWNNTGKDGSLGSHGNIGGGSLKGGNNVFIQLYLPDAYIGKSNIKRYLTLTNTHDGTKSVGYGNGNQVVCCANTFAVAFKEISKIRHTASMEDRINEATIILKRMFETEEQQIEIFDKASKIELNNGHISSMVNAIFDNILTKDDKDVSTKQKNQAAEFAKDLQTSLDEQGNTLWALFNGVTRYTNHTRSVKDKDFSLMFGTDAKMNQKAFNLMESAVLV